MAHRVWCISILFILLATGAPVALAQDSEIAALKTNLEHLRTEVARLRGLVEESRTRLEQNQRFSGMERYRFPQTVQLFGQPMPLQRRDLWERMDREFLLSVHDVPRVLLWMKRAHRYFPFIQEQLRAKGLPEDLKYVAIAESALRPEASSHAGAMGLWQFIPATGSKYQLQSNRWVDERRDAVKSTRAALAYLHELHETFGNWLLALAAYNVGEKIIQKELKHQNVTSYYDLVLPAETHRFIFRIAAAKVILANPKSYGFELTDDELYEPWKAERLEARVQQQELDLVALAQACGMTFRTFMNLNPHLLSSSIPRGHYALYVPPEKSKIALAFIQKGNHAHAHYKKAAASR